jgi:hypothetical protein
MSHFIVIEGLIGVGKTSLCRILEKEWGARLILEPWEHNPFLAAFYSDRERYAFPAQMFYLASRFAQQQQLQPLRQGPPLRPGDAQQRRAGALRPLLAPARRLHPPPGLCSLPRRPH